MLIAAIPSSITPMFHPRGSCRDISIVFWLARAAHPVHLPVVLCTDRSFFNSVEIRRVDFLV